MIRAMAFLALLATPAGAQTWKMRDGDALLSPDALRARLSGHTLVFHDGGRSVYMADGKYHYTYGGGGTWYGYWDIPEAGLVCVTFVTGVERCDRIVMNGGRVVVLTDKGERFPVRSMNENG